MKKFLKTIILTSFVLGAFLFTQNAKAEVIKNYEVNFEPHKSGEVFVTEKIIYDFENADGKHGIYRDIPISYINKDKSKIIVDKLIVVDENNLEYQTLINQGSNSLHIRIGDPDIIINGIKTYIIKYRVQNLVQFFDDYEFISWNFVGNEWQVPVESFAPTMNFSNIENWPIKQMCYFGPLGSTKNCDDFTPVNTNNTMSLRPGEGVTFDMSFEKGTFAHKSILSMALDSFKYSAGFFFKFLLIILSFSGIKFFIRHRKHKILEEGLPVQYEPLPNNNLFNLGLLYFGWLDNKIVTASIFELATNGYFKIGIEDKKERQFIVFEMVKDHNDLDSYKKSLVERIFIKKPDIGAVRKIRISNDPLVGQMFVLNLNKQISKALVADGLLKKNYLNSPEKLSDAFRSFRFMTTIFFTFVVIVNIISGKFTSVETISLFLLLIFFFLIFSLSIISIKNKIYVTPKGIPTLKYLLGLRKYISMAEAKRLEFNNAPEMNVQHFEKLLPYAILFGLEKKWTQKFESILSANPSWYIGSGTFSSGFISDFTKSVSDSISSSSGSSGGGSGFSGGDGGSSGGGGGGGGGGSW